MCTHLCISDHVAVHLELKAKTNISYNIVSHLHTNTRYKLQRMNVSSIPLKPWWPGLLSHPWSLGRLGSQGWTVMGLTELGRVCQPMSPAAWTWWACSPLHRPTTSGSKQVLLQWNYAYWTKRMWRLWAGRTLKSPVGAMSPGAGVPTSNLLP